MKLTFDQEAWRSTLRQLVPGEKSRERILKSAVRAGARATLQCWEARGGALPDRIPQDPEDPEEALQRRSSINPAQCSNTAAHGPASGLEPNGISPFWMVKTQYPNGLRSGSLLEHRWDTTVLKSPLLGVSPLL